MTQNTRAVAVALAMAFAVTQAGAAETFDTIFKTGTLAELEAGDVLTYRHQTRGADPDDPSSEGTVSQLSLALESGDAAVMSERRDETDLPIASFDASVGNPMAMFFFETTVRAMAEATGGSPFYIRNRIKDSLGKDNPIVPVQATFDGRLIGATKVTLSPFDEDASRDKMGAFADLTLEVLMSDAVPGWYLSFDAVAGDGDGQPAYADSIVFERLEDE